MTLIQKISYGVSAAAVAATMLVSVSTTFAQAATAPTSPVTAAQNNLAAAGGQAGVATTITLPELVGRIINIVLGFLGVIFLALAVYGGFEWMTAQGDSKQVQTAKDIIKNAVIGLVVIAAAYAISSFAVTSILSATTAP